LGAEDYKILEIRKAIQAMRGVSNLSQAKAKVIQWIGISEDEASRMKPSRQKWMDNRWPLIEARMTRSDCISWLKKHKFPEAPRSACVFCPYHDDAEWQRLKSDEPLEFERAVEYEKRLQESMRQVQNFRGKPFLHRSLIPLSEVNFKPRKGPKQFQTNFNFVNECMGFCGV